MQSCEKAYTLGLSVHHTISIAIYGLTMRLFKKCFSLNSFICLCLSSKACALVPLPGNGTKSQAMGGVATALPLDTFSMATNPAITAFLNDRYDLDITYIRPNDDVRIRNNPLIPNKRYNSSPNFIVPLVGIKKDYSPCIALGACTFGRGAAVNYGQSIPIYGTSKFKLSFIEVIAKPCFAWRINENHAIGIGINLSISQFKHDGAQNLRAISSDPNQVSNKGHDYRPGIGFHIGWVGRFFERLKLGIALESQIFNQRFRKYRGLIAEHGKANGPSIISAGFSYDFPCQLTIAFDFQRYFWKPLRAFSNPLTFDNLLGTTHGSGQGWHNENRYKVGVAYQFNENITLRAGYQYQTVVFSNSQLYNNVNAVTNFPSEYITGGFSWIWGCNEVNFVYMQSINLHLRGNLPIAVGGGEISTKTLNQIIGMSWGHQF